MPALNKSAKAVRVMELLGTKAGRHARIGNVDRFQADPRVQSLLREMDKRTAEAVDLVDRLSVDETRTDVAKHARAKKAATALGDVLRDGHDRMNALADEHYGAATAMLDEFLNIDSANPFMLGKKFDWIANAWKDGENGVARIRDAIRTDSEAGALMVHSAAYLLGIPEESRLNFVDLATKTHCPQAHEKLALAKLIRETADKLPEVISDVHDSFYQPAIAIREATRVED